MFPYQTLWFNSGYSQLRKCASGLYRPALGPADNQREHTASRETRKTSLAHATARINDERAIVLLVHTGHDEACRRSKETQRREQNHRCAESCRFSGAAVEKPLALPQLQLAGNSVVLYVPSYLAVTRSVFAFGVQDFGLFWVMTSGNVPVFSAYWFNTGYMSTSVYGGFW